MTRPLSLSLASRTSSGGDSAIELEDFMKDCGLGGWYPHISRHTTIKTPGQLRMMTAVELSRMATKANMRLDRKITSEFLAAVRKGKVNKSSPSALRRSRSTTPSSRRSRSRSRERSSRARSKSRSRSRGRSSARSDSTRRSRSRSRSRARSGGSGASKEAVTAEVNKAGDKIREAKAAKTFVSRKDSLLAELKAAKAKYQDVTGEEWPADVAAREKNKKK